MKKTIFYIGLNDKETKAQKISTLEAADIINRLTLQYYGGATISNARGIYTHEDGRVVCEETIRVEVLDASEEKNRALAEDLKRVLNQESILVESQSVNFDFV